VSETVRTDAETPPEARPEERPEPRPERPRGDGPLLDVRDVQKRFGGLQALSGATLDVAPGSITALIGPNGAGKTTLFHAITGFHKPDAGQITFDGERIEGKPPHRTAKRGLVRTFQLTKALTRMSVLENVMLAAPSQPGERLVNVLFRPLATRNRELEVEQEAMELLRLVRLDRLADEYAGTLSGGQRKLLEFARALMARPRMILLDEPMAGVNPSLGLQLLDHMRAMQEERGLTFLLIEHDMEVVMSVSERVIVMNEGHVIAEGPPETVRADQRVIDAYLGTHREDAA
jgi:neutral amino acid transport system ATP-binding protein